MKAKEQAATQLLSAGSTESKLRVATIEIETLRLQKADEERKVVLLEEKVGRLQASKNKEEEYLGQLGKSCENIRKEKQHVKDL